MDSGLFGQNHDDPLGKAKKLALTRHERRNNFGFGCLCHERANVQAGQVTTPYSMERDFEYRGHVRQFSVGCLDAYPSAVCDHCNFSPLPRRITPFIGVESKFAEVPSDLRWISAFGAPSRMA